MSTAKGQPSENTKTGKQSRKRRRKVEEGPGKMLRDFLQRTGLNDDIEEFVAHVARKGIDNLWQTFTPIETSQPLLNWSPEEPHVDAEKADPDDPYIILGVHRNTPPEIMKAVYHAWAKHHHPDVGGDEETFKKVNIAWDKIKQERGF